MKTYSKICKGVPTLAEVFEDGKTAFEEISRSKMFSVAPWAPFAEKDEWELTRWLTKNVNQRATKNF